MTFILSNSQGLSYTFPLDPQHYTANITPRYSTEKTLGGEIVQLLGFAMDVTLTGLLNNHMDSQQGYWNDQALLEDFMANLMLAQRDGIPSHMLYDVHDIDYDVAVGDYSISEIVGQKGFTYTIKAVMISNGGIKNANVRNAVFNAVTNQIGFKPGTEGYHGGDLDTSFVKPITGFSNTGPSAGSAGGGGDAKLSSNSSIKEVQDYAHQQVLKRGWSEADFQALVKLWNKESGWNYTATNPGSGAYGIPQSLPGNKMASAGADWKTNPQTQVNWGLDYIAQRYGTPSAAWQHSVATNWY